MNSRMICVLKMLLAIAVIFLRINKKNFLLSLWILAMPLASMAQWSEIGEGELNASALSADYPSLAVASQLPSVAFVGTTGTGCAGNVYVSSWDQKAWNMSASLNLSPGKTAQTPRLTQTLGYKTAVWVEDTGTTVLALHAKNNSSGTTWNALGTDESINRVVTQSAATPAITGIYTLSNFIPYLAWSETSVTPTASNYVYAGYLPSASGQWQPLGGNIKLNINDAASWEAIAPAIASTPNRISIAWEERILPGASPAASKIYVKTYTFESGSWSCLGNMALNANLDHSAQQPSITAWQDQAAVAWSEYDGKSWKVYVKRWTGSAWQLLGSALNMDADMDASQPCIAAEGNTLAVIWKEQGATATQVYAKYWDNQTWRPLGASLNQSITSNAGNPQLQVDGGRLFSAWSEETSMGMSVYVKSWGDGLPLHYDVLPIYENRLRALGNKFNPAKGEACTLEWCLAKDSNISITLYTLDGRKVRGLIRNQPYSGGGPYTQAWDGKNDQGSLVASGIYLALIEAGDFKKWVKIGVVK